MFKYIVITSVKDEGKNIEKTIVSIVNQTILPQEWVIVNDGSSDDTKSIIVNYAKKYRWIKLVDRRDSREYELGARIVENIYIGLQHVISAYDYLVKLDGDLSFEKDYFEYLSIKFEANPRLGMASGQSYVLENNELIWEDTPEDHVKGLMTTYRRSCFNDIGGLIRSLGWDTVDELSARMKGWDTRSFKEQKIIHHRRLGSKMGILKGNRRHGYIAYIIGSHPLYVLFRCIYRIFEKPYVSGSLAYMQGYLNGFIRKEKRVVSKEMQEFRRKEQLEKLLSKNFYLLYVEKYLKRRT